MTLLRSDYFGTIPYRPESVIEFPRGLPGFDDEHRFSTGGVDFVLQHTSGETAGAALVAVGRSAEVADRMRRFERSWTSAMIAQGRSGEIVDAPDINGFGRLYARWTSGSLARLLADPSTPAESRALALCRLDRAAEAVELTPTGHPALLYLGRAQQLLDQRPLSPSAANEALLALGRLAEAAGAGVGDIPGSGGSATALWLLGRDDEAEAAAGAPHPGMRLLAALEAGRDPAAELAVLEAAHRPFDHRRISARTWFSWTVLRQWPLLADRAAWRAAMRRMAHEHRWTAAQRIHVFCRTLAGDATLAELPFANEAVAWTAVADGLLAESAGDAAAALAAYRRFADLPLHRRLVDENKPGAEVERFVAWRLRVLAR